MKGKGIVVNKLLLTGGTEKQQQQEEWSGFQSALALELDIETGMCEKVLDYFTPDDARPPLPECSVLFKSSELHEDQLVATTQTEVLIYQLPNYELKTSISLPFFNDVHHARFIENGNILVCATGLDSVFEVTVSGELINSWNVLGKPVWDKFEQNVDYRKVLTTKPHSAHPNFCFEANGEKFVTRFKQKDAISLDSDKRFDINVGGPHDGYVMGGNVYFTTVNGFVVGFDVTTCEKILEVDLNDFNENKSKNLGWCRSLYMLNESEAIVGFSRMRTSKFSDYLSWVKEKTGAGTATAFPTRVVKYNFETKKIDWTVNIENHQMNAVFSILAL